MYICDGSVARQLEERYKENTTWEIAAQEKLPKGSVIILFVYYTLSTGQSQMIGPTEPLVAMTGDDIILPCQLDPARDAVDLTVEWSRRDLKPRFVHLKRDDAELVTQNTLYSRRTSLSVNKLKCGDISLKLSKVQVSDAGMYNCLVPEIGAETGMELIVGKLISIPFALKKKRKTLRDGILTNNRRLPWMTRWIFYWEVNHLQEHIS